MKEGSHFERFVGGSESDKRKAREKLEENKSEDLSKYELEKTPEDIETIKKTEATVNEIVTQYGGEGKPLSLDRIYVLEPDSVSKITEGRLLKGIHKILEGVVGVEKEESKLEFVGTLGHDLFHLKSYKAASIGNSAEDIRPYRSGFSMYERDFTKEAGKEKVYFGMLEEAIVAECTKKPLKRIKEKDEDLSKEYEANEKLKEWVYNFNLSEGVPKEKIEAIKEELFFVPDAEQKVEKITTEYDDEKSRQAFAAGLIARLSKDGSIGVLERYQEREKMYNLLDELVAKSEGRFKNRSEIFDEFAKANFSGNYLNIARIVESILGKGSFRKIAEDFSEN